MERKEERDKLIEIGAERLADGLLYLASRFGEVAEYVEALLLSPEEVADRFKRKLSSLKRRRRFVDWHAAPAFAAELELMLAGLRESVHDPQVGLELVKRFFQCDRAVLNLCDDSSGVVGEVFRYDAAQLFARYAAAHPDSSCVSDTVFELYAEDDYGVREGILDALAEALPPEQVRALIARFWDQGKSEPPGSFAADRWWIGIETLARRLGDANMFEKAKLQSDPRLTPGTCLDIAKVYLEAGDPQMALFWMKRIPSEEQYLIEDRDMLLYSIHEQLGNREEMKEVAWRIFHRSRSASTLKMLMRALGEQEREQVVEGEVHKIMGTEKLSYQDAAFLIELGRMEEAEEYLLKHREELDGDVYFALVPLAKALEERGYPLGATVVYRALLESILRRAQSRYYHHGVRYLKKLDALAMQITDWRGIAPHSEYVQELLAAHGRKYSFWGKYGKPPLDNSKR